MAARSAHARHRLGAAGPFSRAGLVTLSSYSELGYLFCQRRRSTSATWRDEGATASAATRLTVFIACSLAAALAAQAGAALGAYRRAPPP